MKTTTLALLLLAAALPTAASRILPAEPFAFEPIVLRMTVDGCAFVPQTVRVRTQANVLKVTQHPNNCLVAGPIEIADVRLGTLAVGAYQVELFGGTDESARPIETLAFEVRSRPEVAVFPPPPRPINDHSGLWWTPAESGWGLSLHQSATDAMFGSLFVYGSDREAQWFTLQGGHWENATRWTAIVYRTTGPFFAGPVFDPRLVLIDAVGTATLDFHQVPGGEGHARLTYDADGVSVSKVIERMGL
jgi:hypothetical protein